MTNERVYIHEFVDIIGHNRANYMQHMVANWSPEAQEERRQLCYGVWAVVGSTGRWPQVLNIWEHESWDGLASSFAVETVGRGAQDARLEKWWAKAAEFRSGGIDRILEPARWTRTSPELCGAGITGECYAHELVELAPGSAPDFLDRVRDRAASLADGYGWQLAGAWKTAMVNDDECILLWAIPTWQQWAALEQAWSTDPAGRAWRAATEDIVRRWQRILLVDAPLSPFRTGRQPTQDDRIDWEG